jgi:hypothetical protein
MLSPLVQSITDEELAHIATLDYGQDSQQHLKALRSVIFEQDGELQNEQTWHPYEVIELCTHSLKPCHEREFAICTLLVIQAVASGLDSSTDLSAKLNDRAKDYDYLPPDLRDTILNAYQSAES